MKPLISVIVPVYNAGLSIEKCAKSILTQTFSNLELILIDDGSTDNSLFICRSLASQDARITVRHQSNQGVSKARNLGISISKGEWIAFVDADDYLYEYYLSGLLMQTTDCELVIGGYNKVLLSEKKEFPGVLFPEMVLSKSNVDCQEISDKVLLYGTPWGKLFKSSLIKENNIIFPVNFTLHEDHIFFYETLLHTNNIRLTRNYGYNYVNYGTETLSRKKAIPSDLKCNAFYQLSEMLKNIIQRFNLNKEHLPLAQNFIIRLYISAIILCYRNKDYERKYLKPTIELRKRIQVYHHPISMQGYSIKFILVYLPFCIQRSILKLLIK